MSTGELLFGIHSIEAALTHDPKNILELYFEADSQNARIKELSDRARDLGLKPHSRPREAPDRMTGGARHQGAVARYKAPPPRSENELYELVEKEGKRDIAAGARWRDRSAQPGRLPAHARWLPA